MTHTHTHTLGIKKWVLSDLGWFLSGHYNVLPNRGIPHLQNHYEICIVMQKQRAFNQVPAWTPTPSPSDIAVRLESQEPSWVGVFIIAEMG